MRKNWVWLLSAAVVAVLTTVRAPAQVNVLTNRYNQARTAANLSETILNTTNVTAGNFGKLGTYSVDGIIYAQPLYVQGLTVNGRTHNVLFVATMHNVLYAFDADNPGSAPLWSTDFRQSGYQPYPITVYSTTVADTLGIFSTPVIDLPNNRIFLVVHSTDANDDLNFTLFNLNILTGAVNASAPISIAVPAAGAEGGVSLTPGKYFNQRPALELVNGQLWIGFGSLSPGDNFLPWYGFVATYNANTLVQTGAFATSRSNGNSIWQSGMGPAVDSAGNVYYTTGNGGNYDGQFEFPNSLLKFDFNNGPSLLDWYTPDNPNGNDNYILMNNADLDLSVCGPLLVPNTDLIALGSKTANVEVLHTGQGLGHLTSGDTQLAQYFRAGNSSVNVTANDSDRIVGMAYWPQAAGGYLYVWAGLETLHAFSLNPSTSTFSQVATGTLTLPGQPASALAVSANGTTAGTGILWAPHINLNYENTVYGQPGLLHAYNAATLQELWNSNQVSTDNMGTLAKFVPPVVVNGKVYIANSATTSNTSAGSVTVFGLLTPASPPITVTIAPVTLTQGTYNAFTAAISGASSAPANLGLGGVACVNIAGCVVNLSGNGVPLNFEFSNVGTKSATLGIFVSTSVPPGAYSIPITAGTTQVGTLQLTVPQLAQTITFGSIAAQKVGVPLSLSATASSGLAVSFASSTANVCTVSGTSATFVGAGTCTITASQAGNATYAGATPVSQSFTVAAASKVSVTIAPVTLTQGTYNAFTAAISGASSAPATLGLGGVACVNIAGCVVNLSGNGVPLNFEFFYVGTTSATLGIFVSTSVPPGAYSIPITVGTAQVGTLQLTVPQLAQTITFGSIAAQKVGVPLSLSATASSGLAVSFASSTASVCTVSGNSATFVGAGTCTITASQAGNATYAGATPVSQSFTVAAASKVSVTIAPVTLTQGTYNAFTATISGASSAPATLGLGGVACVNIAGCVVNLSGNGVPLNFEFFYVGATSATLGIFVSPSVPPGAYSIPITIGTAQVGTLQLTVLK